MNIPAHWTGSSHVTQAAIRVQGADEVSGRFHYPSNGNEQMYAVTGTTIDRFTTFARGTFLQVSEDIYPKSPPTAYGQKTTSYKVSSSVLWNLKLTGWSQYLKWLESPSPPRGSFWGRHDGTSNYSVQSAAQNSYKLKAQAVPKSVGFIGSFRNYAFSADGTVTDYLLWAFLGGGTSQNVILSCPDFASSVYFPYFTTGVTYEEKQALLKQWPTKHLSFGWTGDT